MWQQIKTLFANRDKRGHPDVFKIQPKKEYREYCCKILHSMFSYINAHSVKILSKSEMVELEICPKLVELTWNDPYIYIIRLDVQLYIVHEGHLTLYYIPPRKYIHVKKFSLKKG